MARRTLLVDSLPVTINEEDPQPPGVHLWGIVHARLVDDVTGRPITVPVQIEPQEAGLAPRVAADGLVGLAGIPREIFPDLDARSYTVHFTVRAAGYQDMAVTAVITRAPTFPAAFTPADAGTLRLRR